MIYDRYAIHQYKYIIGAIDVYSRFAVARPLTNMRMSTLMENLKDMFEEISDIIGKKKAQYPENINADQQFNKPDFVNFFTKQGTKLWFSQPSQIHHQPIIERFWRTLALLIQRYRQGIKKFDWPNELPDVLENYNTTLHRTLKATPLEVIQGKKSNPVQRKIVDSTLKKGDKVRIKTQKTVYSKGDIETLSRYIYLIVSHKGMMSQLKNIRTGQILSRLYHDEELGQTWSVGVAPYEASYDINKEE